MNTRLEQELDRDRALFDRCAFEGTDGKYSRDNYWKRPLRVVVEADEVRDMEKAILNTCGGLDRTEELESGLVLITSRGYHHYVGA